MKRSDPFAFLPRGFSAPDTFSFLGEQFQDLFKDGRMFLVGHTVLLGVE